MRCSTCACIYCIAYTINTSQNCRNRPCADLGGIILAIFARAHELHNTLAAGAAIKGTQHHVLVQEKHVSVLHAANHTQAYSILLIDNACT